MTMSNTGLLVGCGRMGQRHLKYLNQTLRLGDFYIVDPTQPNVEGRHLGMLKNLEEGLQKKPSWAIVAVSTPFHFEVGEKLLKAGVTTLMEKPLAPTFEECQKLLQLSELTKTPLYVGHVERFNPVIKTVRDGLASGGAGPIQCLHIARYGSAPAEVNGSNNVVVDLTVHDIDILFSLGLLPEFQTALNLKSPSGYIDHSDSLFLTQNNALVSLSTSWRSAVRKRTLRILCERGIIEADLVAQTITWSGPEIKWDPISPIETLGVQLNAFADAIEGRDTILCPATHASKVVELAEKIVLFNMN